MYYPHTNLTEDFYFLLFKFFLMSNTQTLSKKTINEIFI